MISESSTVASGALSFDFAVEFICVRSKLLNGNPLYPGAMAAVACTEDALRQHIETLTAPNSVTIAVYNTHESHVMSGEASAVDTLVSSMKEKGVRAVKLKVDQGE
jgi:acyl transferase domain-containing protein